MERRKQTALSLKRKIEIIAAVEANLTKKKEKYM